MKHYGMNIVCEIYIGLDALLWYVDQCMILGDNIAQNRINDDKTPNNTVPLCIPL